MDKPTGETQTLSVASNSKTRLLLDKPAGIGEPGQKPVGPTHSQQLNHFKNEARAAATLDHPDIVAVHAVAVERGVHYNAMQWIDGPSGAELIGDLQNSNGIAAGDGNIHEGQAITFAGQLLRAPATDGGPVTLGDGRRACRH